jgi:hypothetical protein
MSTVATVTKANLADIEMFNEMNIRRFDHPHGDAPAGSVLAVGSERPQVICLEGSPGIGKTAMTKGRLREQYLEWLQEKFPERNLTIDDIGYEAYKCPGADGVEARGLGLPNKDNTRVVATVSPLIEQVESNGKEFGVFDLSEFMGGEQDLQKVLADLVDPDEHSVGFNPFPEGWLIAANGNQTDDKSGAYALLGHIVGRIKIFRVIFSMSLLGKWWRKQGLNELFMDCAEAHGNEDGSDWFAQTTPADNLPYCSPRSMKNASIDFDCWLALPSTRFDGTIPQEIVNYLAGSIGNKRAAQFAKFVTEQVHLPSVDEIMSDPDNAPVPEEFAHQRMAAYLAMGAVDCAETAAAALHYIVRTRADIQVPCGAQLMGICTRNGYTITDPLAADFIERFSEFLPLALER